MEAVAQREGVRPLIVIDEIQKVPALLDVVQDLIDQNIAQFILTGSSARKLRQGSKVNLLPGRLVVLHLDPLLVDEIKDLNPLLEDVLYDGTLPGILTIPNPEYRERDLFSYVTTYLEEEVRAEALVRNIGMFSKFLALAASESGGIIQPRKISQDIGVAHTTIMDYYQILEDCLIAERIDSLRASTTRRRLSHGSKYLFFDLGVRRLSAEEGRKLSEKNKSFLFEQWVGLELLRLARLISPLIKIYF